MTDKQIIDKLKNDIACKENMINHLAEHNIRLQDQFKRLKLELKVTKADYNKAIQKLIRIEEYCKDCNLKCDYTACAILQIIDEGDL